MHKFENGNLYGCLLKVCIIGYLRPEKNFDSLDALIAAIRQDIEDAEQLLENPENVKMKSHEFFNKRSDENVIMNGQKSANGHKTEINGHTIGSQNGNHTHQNGVN